MTSLPVSFTCDDGMLSVPHSLVCDHRQDCSDDSDEDFCTFSPCDLGFECENKQCLRGTYKEVCDRDSDCLDGSDEATCKISNLFELFSPLPYIVTLSPVHGISLKSVKHASCSESRFLCPGIDLCLPVFVLCNGFNDCPGHEDEARCDSFTCPGFYRCRGSRVCVHANDVCDGVTQCPEDDDELFCSLQCPHSCQCLGNEFVCRQPFRWGGNFTMLRYLDARGSGTTLRDVSDNLMLVYLSLAACGLQGLHKVQLPNIRSLDLSHNRLDVIKASDFSTMPSLRTLVLAGNTITSLFASYLGTGDRNASQVTGQDDFLPAGILEPISPLSELRVLNLSDCGLTTLDSSTLAAARGLHVLDARGCPVTSFSRDVFMRLENLKALYADNYKLCCPAMLPKHFSPTQCRAPFDEISSCEALLQSDMYRVSLAVFSSLALLLNLGSFINRVVESRSKTGFGVFVLHLCVSDFVMGLYLAIIGVADRLYQGSYVWQDTAWRHSTACRVAGFSSLVSCEVSAMIICLITADRFIVLRFPFSRLRFQPGSAHLACVLCWGVGLLLATVPLLPLTAHWSFYSQTGICIPLPVTRNTFTGHHFAFAVMIVVNFVLFLLIGAGQFLIYVSITTQKLSGMASTQRSQDLTIARRLVMIVVSDFLCWFPIGVLGLLAATGTPVSGEVNVAMAIFVLPINSALNPFFYTLNSVLEKRRRRREERLMKDMDRGVLAD